MKKLLLFALSFVIFSLGLLAQDSYLVEIKPGKKVLHASEVNLPPTTTLGELLTCFPELLARDEGKRLENYDLQVLDVSVDEGRETILENIRLCDIKEIEVSKNPGTSQQKNGQGGVINVVLRDLDSGVSGRAHFCIGTHFGTTPGATVNYHKEKIDIRSTLLFEYYNPRNYLENTFVKKNDRLSSFKLDTCDYKTGYQLFNFHLKYYPSKKHTLKFWLREGYGITSAQHNIFNDHRSSSFRSNNDSKTNNLNVYTGANYELKLDRGGLEVQAEYTLNPQYYNSSISETFLSPVNRYEDKTFSQNIAAYAKGKFQIVPTTPKQKCELIAGCNTTFSPTAFDYSFSGKAVNPERDLLADMIFEAKGNVLYLSPFIECNSIFGPFFLKGGLRFQYYHYFIDVDHDKFKSDRNDWTSFINFGWQVAPHHHLSLILDRSIRRPSGSQIYPYSLYDPTQGKFSIGNEFLRSASLHTASLNYITDIKFKSGHSVIINLGAEYINSRRLINANSISEYISYSNNKNSDIADINASILYECGVFSLAFTSNLFQNWSTVSSVKDSYFYYNISLVPMLQFGGGWGISSQFTYNSHIETVGSSLSDYFFSHVRFNKTLNKMTFFLELSDNFHDSAEDIIYGLKETTHKYYNLHFPSLNVGFSYKF